MRTDPQTRKITSIFNAGQPQTQIQDNEVDIPMEEYEIVEKERVPVKLGSIRELREEVMEKAHNGIPIHDISL